MSQINLLPLDLSPARGVLKLATSLRRVSYITLGVFLTILTLGVIYIVFLRLQVNSSLSNQQTLTKNIQNLESTEQKLYLTKDRVGKVKKILASSRNPASYNGINQILSTLNGNASPYSLEINSNKAIFSVLAKDSISMAGFFNSLVISGDYKKLDLISFIFTPDRGYLVTFGRNGQ